MTQPNGTLPAGSRVFGYARDSGGAGQERSVGQQAQAIRETCQAHGWELLTIFADEAKSGGSDVGRNGLAALVETAKKGKAAGIVFWSSARFARDVDDAQYYRSTLRKRGYALVSISDPVPEAGVYTPVLEALQDVQNADYRAKLGADVRRGMAGLVAAGFAPGYAPVGYRGEQVEWGADREGRPRLATRWVVDEGTAPKVRQAWRMRAEGRTLRDIHRATQVYPSGNRFSYLHLFRNKIYMGVYEYGGREYPAFAEALISPETWAAVQERRMRFIHPRRAGSVHMLSGIARCGACGAAMMGKSYLRQTKDGKREHRYYLCQDLLLCRRARVRAGVLDARVIAAVNEALSADRLRVYAASWAESAGQDAGARQAEIDRVAGELADLDRAIARLLDSLEAGASVGKRLAAREGERKAKAEQLAALAAAPAVPAPDPVMLGELRERLNYAYAEGEAREARAVLRLLVEWVEFTPEETRVHLRRPMG